MATPYNLVSADAQLRLTEFSDAYAAALAMGAPNTWAKDFGLAYSSNAIRTVYPLPVSAAGYKLRQGDDKLRALYEKSLSIKPVEYQDGVQEKAQIIEAPDFIGWQQEPSKIALETLRFPNKLVAQLLKDNPTLEFDGKALFADDHPINVLDDGVKDVAGNATFDNNLSSGTLAGGVVGSAAEYFAKLPGPNGEVMGLQLTHVLVPSALQRKFREYLESDVMYNAMLAGTTNTNFLSKNLYANAVTPVFCPELKDADVVYWIAAGGPPPWIVQDGGTPEEIRYEKDSDYYKDTGYLAVKYILRMGTAAALPHAIAKQQVTG
jgi:phage major head subunit gpT-like protein